MTPSKPGFQHPISISNIVEVYLWGYEGKRSSDGLVVRARVRYLCRNRQKTEAEHPHRPPGLSYSIQILPASYIYSKTLIMSKKDYAQTFGHIIPSDHPTTSYKGTKLEHPPVDSSRILFLHTY